MYTIVSDGAVLAPYQKSDGTWGWYLVELSECSVEVREGTEEEVLINVEAETLADLVVPFDAELEEEEEE